MNFTALKAAMPTSESMMHLPISQLSLCPDCGELYKSSYTFYCPQSQGMESDAAQCPTFECREDREEGQA